MPSRVAVAIAVVPAVVMFAVPGGAAADVFEVTKRADHATGACTNADCTLREAVIAANGLAGKDRVELPSRKPYRLTREFDAGEPEPEHGDLDLDASGMGDGITLVHPGAGQAKVDASGAEDRAIELVGTATLRKLVLRDGDANSSSEAGGVISAEGDLTIVGCRIKAGHAADVGGGIFTANGSLEMRRSAVTGNEANGEGGGIFVNEDSALLIVKSTVSRNRADEGGGIFTQSEVGDRVATSTIADNRTTEEGGGIYNAGTDLVVTNATIADNRSDLTGGGVYGAPDTFARLSAVTVAFNRADADDAGGGSGGGLFGDGGVDVVRIQNSLIARNRSTGGAVQECDAPAPVGIESLGGNLITTEAGGCDFLTDSEDLVDPNPRIRQLRDNGGPTKTVALRSQSPALGQADGPAPPDRDQRGVDRQNPDIGAFERE